MKIRMTLLLMVVFAIVLTLGSTAQAVVVHTDTAAGNVLPDLTLPNAGTLDHIGPGGVGDTTPFGPGLWEVNGAMNQVGNNDDGDGWNWEVAAGNTFDLSWNMPGTNFTTWENGFNQWNTGGDVGSGTSGTTLGLAAGQYSGGGFEQFPHNWTWSITVQPIPEPSSIVLGCIGAFGLGLVGWRTRKNRK